MAAPLLPVAGLILRYGTVALAGYAMARQLSPGRRDQRAEDALDELEEGITWRSEPGQTNSTARFCRTIRIGRSGPGFKIDAALTGRIRIRKVK